MFLEHILNELCATKDWAAALDLLIASDNGRNGAKTVDVNEADRFGKTHLWWVLTQKNPGDKEAKQRLVEFLLSKCASLFCGRGTSSGRIVPILDFKWETKEREFSVDQLVYTAVMYPTPLPPHISMVPTFFSKMCFCLAGSDYPATIKDILSELCLEIRARHTSVVSCKRIVAILGAVNPNFFVRNAEFVQQTVIVIHSKVKRLRDHIRDKTSEVPRLKPLCIHSVRNRCKHIAKGRSIIPTIKQLECTVPKSIVHDLLLIHEFHGWDYDKFYDYIRIDWY